MTHPRNESKTFPALAGVIWVSLAAAVMPASATYTFTRLDAPSAVNTEANGVSGGTVVGGYTDADNIHHGFIYDGSVFTALDDPLAIGKLGTEGLGISGGTVVGRYFAGSRYHGFIYNAGAFTTLDDTISAIGVSGSTIVGSYGAGGFVYNGSIYTMLDDPLAEPGTQPLGVSGSTIVGYYLNMTGIHGFIYDGSSYTTLDVGRNGDRRGI